MTRSDDPRDEALSFFDAPEKIIAAATRWLVAHPDAPLIERVACATVIACGGDLDGEATFSRIAHYAGSDVTPEEAMQALLAMREQREAQA